MDLAALHAEILKAHERKDIPLLAELYNQAGNNQLKTGDIDAGCFYLTHAYVFALEAGLSQAKDIHETLVAHGREE